MKVQNMQSIAKLEIGRHYIHWKAWQYQQTERRAGRIGSGLEKFCRGLGDLLESLCKQRKTWRCKQIEREKGW